MFMSQLSSSSSSSSSPGNNNHKRRLTRAKQLRHLRHSDVVKHSEKYFLNSPVRNPHHHNISLPLPLPELSALLSGADKLLVKETRKSHCFRLPSPATLAHTASGVTQDGRRSSVDAPPPSADEYQTWSAGNAQQKTTMADQAQQNSVLDDTSVSSPVVSPQRTLNNDESKQQRLSELPVPTAGLPYTTREESNAVRCLNHHNSMLHTRPIKVIKSLRKSASGRLSSPRHPSNIEMSSFHNDTNVVTKVHPLPLPPSNSPAAFPQAANSHPVRNQWTKGKLIGRGTFGSVYVATNRETGALCAMKEVELCPDDPNSRECIRQLEQEIKVLSRLKHPNIVQYYGSEIAGDRFYIYLEYVYPGSINKYVHEHCGAITEAVVRNFTRHICSGLAFLHGRKTIHRDIKGANLLVDSSGVVKLADFGMAKHITGQAGELSMKGSPFWMAPELMQSVLQKDNRSDLALAVDIWSLGCTVIEMLTGKPPWSEYEGAAAMFKVLKESPSIPESLSPEGKDFLNCCFRRNPADRPSATKLLEHSFLNNCQQLDVPNSGPRQKGDEWKRRHQAVTSLSLPRLDHGFATYIKWHANANRDVFFR